ncbi:hypothetical protein R1flu_013342 [Riccia fluitans]|uniref:F-box domain-containing protein n=1 Tax=Riccia fluitans TaxID=41844 RepID=A0ABD1YDA8_9MARC
MDEYLRHELLCPRHSKVIAPLLAGDVYCTRDFCTRHSKIDARGFDNYREGVDGNQSRHFFMPLLRRCLDVFCLKWMVIMEERGTELDPRLWERLPPELIMRVIRKLPLKNLLLCRSVCSGWKAMIENDQIVFEGLPGKSLILDCHPTPNNFLILDSRRWEIQDPCLVFMNSRGSVLQSFDDIFLVRGNIPRNASVLMAAEGGLLCFTCFKLCLTLVVSNPITHRWRELCLPSPLFPTNLVHPDGYALSVLTPEIIFSYILVGLSVDQETGNYKLVVAGFGKDGPKETHVYDSAEKRWKSADPVPSMPITLTNGRWVTERGICCGGNIYWHVEERGGYPEDSHEVPFEPRLGWIRHSQIFSYVLLSCLIT